MGRVSQYPVVMKVCETHGEEAPHTQYMSRGELVTGRRCQQCEADYRREIRAQREAIDPNYRQRKRDRERAWRQTENGRALTERWQSEPARLEHYRNYDHSEKGKARTKRAQRQATLTGKDAARQAVIRAEKRGDLVRPDTCEQCGCKPGLSANGCTLIEVHHYLGYAKEHHLHVKYLCPSCHHLAENAMRLGMEQAIVLQERSNVEA